MNIVSEIKDWTEGFLEKGLFVVEVELKTGSKKIVVYIDGDAGVPIDECRKVSRYISEKLDELDYGDEAYQFEVSTPGVDAPLRLERQYPKHIGRELRIKLKSNTELLGKLTQVNGNRISLMLKDKKNGYMKDPTIKEIELGDIAESIVQISFK